MRPPAKAETATRTSAYYRSFGAAIEALAAAEAFAQASGLQPVAARSAAQLGPLHWQAMLAREGLGLAAEGGVQRLTPAGALAQTGTLLASPVAVEDVRGILLGSGVDPFETASMRFMRDPAVVAGFDAQRDDFFELSRQLDAGMSDKALGPGGALALLNLLHWRERFGSAPAPERWKTLAADALYNGSALAETQSDRRRNADTVLEIVLRHGLPLPEGQGAMLERMMRGHMLGDAAGLLLMSGADLPQLTEWPKLLRLATAWKAHTFLAAALIRLQPPPDKLTGALDTAMQARDPVALHLLMRSGATRPGLAVQLLEADRDGTVLRAAIGAGFDPAAPLPGGERLFDIALKMRREEQALLLLHAGAASFEKAELLEARLKLALSLGFDRVAAALVAQDVTTEQALTALEALPIDKRGLPKTMDAVLARLPQRLDYKQLARLLPLAAAAGTRQMDEAVERAGGLETSAHNWLAGLVADAARTPHWPLLHHVLNTARPDLQKGLHDIFGGRDSHWTKQLVKLDRSAALARLVELGVVLPDRLDVLTPMLVGAVQAGSFGCVGPLLRAQVENDLPKLVFDSSAQDRMRYEMQKGAIDLDATDIHLGQTALHAAVRRCSPEVATMLLKAGASPHIADKAGQTPRALAEAMGQSDLAQRLAEAERAATAKAQPPAPAGHFVFTKRGGILYRSGPRPNIG